MCWAFLVIMSMIGYHFNYSLNTLYLGTGSLAGFHMFNLFCVGDDPRKRIDYNITL